MAAYYFDSSALVKRYSTETGTKFVVGLLRPSSKNSLYSATVTEVEVCAALARKRKSAATSAANATKQTARFRKNFAARFAKADLNNSIIADAIRLTNVYALRGYDAVQLASALAANQNRIAAALAPLILVSADDELNNAAIVEGLSVENPNNHP